MSDKMKETEYWYFNYLKKKNMIHRPLIHVQIPRSVNDKNEL